MTQEKGKTYQYQGVMDYLDKRQKAFGHIKMCPFDIYVGRSSIQDEVDLASEKLGTHFSIKWVKDERWGHITDGKDIKINFVMKLYKTEKLRFYYLVFETGGNEWPLPPMFMLEYLKKYPKGNVAEFNKMFAENRLDYYVEKLSGSERTPGRRAGGVI